MKLKIPNSLIRNILLFGLTLVIVIITWQTKISVQATTDYSNNLDNVDALIEQYHDAMNTIFNKKIKSLVTAMKDNENKNPKELSVLFVPPEYEIVDGLKLGHKECQPYNLSTYCLAIEATTEYFNFRTALLNARTVAETAAGDIKNPTGDLSSAQKNIFTLNKTIDKINQEIDLSRQTLDQALAAYNEMQFALPIHTKYMQVVKSLEKYRDQVSSLRRQVEQFPGTFLDVTTTQCT